MMNTSSPSKVSDMTTYFFGKVFEHKLTAHTNHLNLCLLYDAHLLTDRKYLQCTKFANQIITMSDDAVPIEPMAERVGKVWRDLPVGRPAVRREWC